MNLAEQLTQWNACFLGRLWVTHERTADVQLLWSRCPRAEWMVWYLAQHVRARGGPEHRLTVLAAAFIVHHVMTLPPRESYRVKIKSWREHERSVLSLMRWADTPQESFWSYSIPVVQTPREDDWDVLMGQALALLAKGFFSPLSLAAATEHAMFAMTAGMVREERKKEQRDLADLVRSLVPVCPLLDSSTSPGVLR